MLFRLNNLSRCQNQKGNREGGAESSYKSVCSKWSGKWDIQTWQTAVHSAATLGHKTDSVTACCSSVTGYFLLKEATSCKSPLLLHSRVRQFSFNCPQVVKLRENHCFTQKWVNTNNCFHIPAEWPDLNHTVLMTLSPTSAEFCSCTSPQDSYLHMSNRPSLPGKLPLQITITCKYYKGENIYTRSKLVKQLKQRYWSREWHYWTYTKYGQEVSTELQGLGKTLPTSTSPRRPSSRDFRILTGL